MHKPHEPILGCLFVLEHHLVKGTAHISLEQVSPDSRIFGKTTVLPGQLQCHNRLGAQLLNSDVHHSKPVGSPAILGYLKLEGITN